MPKAASPKATRPVAGYFEDARRLLPWRWAESRLEAARNYWICSTLPDGRPHSRAVWAIWLDGELLFSSGSRIARNLQQRNDVEVHLESADEVVILQGTVDFRGDRETVERFLTPYNAKYNWDFTAEGVGALIAVRPKVVFGWLCDNTGLDRGALYNQTGTRWLFD